MSRDKGRGKGSVSARELALDVLTRVDENKAYSNLQLNSALQRASLSSQDAGLATELVYGTVSRLNTLDYFLERFVTRGIHKLQPWVRNLLRLSLYQIMYLERIPPHAVVNEAVNLAKRRGHQGISGMVNGVLRNVLRSHEQLVLPGNLSPVERIALEHSHPQWLVERWILQYGESAAEAICRANNEPPAVSVRVNTTMISRDEMLAQMKEAGLNAVASALSPEGILVLSGGNMALSDWYRDGQISVQDESSMLVGRAVGPASGMRVLDCCAAPGGKTAHMAELMEDRGEIIANDLHEHKRKLISAQAERLGLDSIHTITGDALDLVQKYAPGSFDRILLDAPCSGLGVIRRKPDLKWTKTPGDIGEIAGLQRKLLDSVSSLLRIGGILVYSTCTIDPEENEGTVRHFLETHPGFGLPEKSSAEWDKLDSAAEGVGVQILPQDYNSDGFYISRLQRFS